MKQIKQNRNSYQNTMNYIEKIVNLIIRPSRDQYHTKRLGDPQITIVADNLQTIRVLREDRVILNKQNEHLHLSYYQIQDIKPCNYKHASYQLPLRNPGQFRYQLRNCNTSSRSPNDCQKLCLIPVERLRNRCVIYLHANNGSRIQGMAYLNQLLKAGLNVCLFDCSGSGMSEGQFVTLGLKQTRDLDSIVNFLTKQKRVQYVSLWGRSMGAVTSLMYASKRTHINISSIVLDSPFKDLQKLILQIASQKTGLPKLFFKPLIPLVRSQILKKTGQNISKLKLKSYIEKQVTQASSVTEIETKSSETLQNHSRFTQNHNPLSLIPALFIVSKNDKFVRCHHGEKLFKRYPCEQKELCYIQIQHHEARQPQIIEKVIKFMLKNFEQSMKITMKEEQKKIEILNFSKNFQSKNKMMTNRTAFTNQASFNGTSKQISITQNDSISRYHNHSFQQTNTQKNHYFNQNQRKTNVATNFMNPYIQNTYFSPLANIQNSKRSTQTCSHPYNVKFNSLTQNQLNYQVAKDNRCNRNEKYSCQDLKPIYQSKQLNFTQKSQIAQIELNLNEKQKHLSHHNSHQNLLLNKQTDVRASLLYTPVKSTFRNQNDKRLKQSHRNLFEEIKYNDSNKRNENLHPQVFKIHNLQNQKEKISLASMLAHQAKLKNQQLRNFSLDNLKNQQIIKDEKLLKFDNLNSNKNPTNLSLIVTKKQEDTKKIQIPKNLGQLEISRPVMNSYVFYSPQLKNTFKNNQNYNNTSRNQCQMTSHLNKNPKAFFSDLRPQAMNVSFISNEIKVDLKQNTSKPNLESLSNRKVSSTFTSLLLENLDKKPEVSINLNGLDQFFDQTGFSRIRDGNQANFK